MRNNYLSLKSYFILLVLSLQFFNAKAQQTYTYNYTGAVQTVNLAAGIYQIDCWGANGESAVGQPTGGVGGYSTGTYTINSPITIYIAVGGKGNLGTATNAFVNGGFNGGGQGFGSTVFGAGGGGASHVATATGVLSSLSGNQSSVLIVAGGGGGSGYSGFGGNGGGAVGGNGNSGTGGNTGGTFGAGANGTNAGTCGGGGGGWFGGNLGSPGNTGGAGGGSGYIGGVTSGTTAQTGQAGFVSKPVVTGDGLILIKELCNITLTASGSNSLSPSICSGQSLTLTTNGISNYAWSTGNTTSSTIAIAPTITTVYTLSATSPSNCTASKSITVTVNSAAPALTFTTAPGTSSVCLGQTATLTAGGAVSYTLVGGPGNLSNGQTFTPTATSSYTITGQNGCGTASVTTTISVSALPVTAVASSTLICSGTPATLTASGATNYTWTSLTASITGSTYIVNPANNTTYSLTGVTGPCAGVSSINIATKSLPTLTITPGSTVTCQGNAVNLTVSGTATAYVWNPVNQTGSSISVTPTVTTLYSVIGTNTNNCVNSTNQVIVVSTRPVINATASDAVVCPGGSSTLTATGANTYVWNGTTAGAMLVVNPVVTTTYAVAGTGTNTCSNATVITVSVFDPSLTVSSSTAVCRGTNVSLSASGMDTYQWSTGSGFSSINVTPTITTTYSVNTTSSQGALTCSVTGAVTVSVNPNPTVTASGSSTIICKGETAVITASGAVTYTWAGSTPEVAAAITVTPSADQTYTVAGHDVNGCKGSGTTLLRVAGCVGISANTANENNLSVYPNPSNGDFIIASDQTIDLKISNELGQQVRTISLTNNNKEVKISGLASGIYFITGQNANGSVKQKLIITE